jgi:uncharacterized protein YneF (UPF0154 family)
MKKEKIVSYRLEDLPPITDERLQEMIAFSQRPIDTSDIPPITTEQMKNAVRGWANHPGRARNRIRPAA